MNASSSSDSKGPFFFFDLRSTQLLFFRLDTLEAAQAENKQIEQMLQKEEKSLEESAVIMLGTIETLTQ